jgi:hypothetical protein
MIKETEGGDPEATVIIGWPKGTKAPIISAWETIFICCLGTVIGPDATQTTAVTTGDLRGRGISGPAAIGCWLLLVGAHREAADSTEPWTIPALATVTHPSTFGASSASRAWAWT